MTLAERLKQLIDPPGIGFTGNDNATLMAWGKGDSGDHHSRYIDKLGILRAGNDLADGLAILGRVRSTISQDTLISEIFPYLEGTANRCDKDGNQVFGIDIGMKMLRNHLVSLGADGAKDITVDDATKLLTLAKPISRFQKAGIRVKQISDAHLTEARNL